MLSPILPLWLIYNREFKNPSTTLDSNKLSEYFLAKLAFKTKVICMSKDKCLNIYGLENYRFYFIREMKLFYYKNVAFYCKLSPILNLIFVLKDKPRAEQ